jgi:uncharacterized protein YigA (DUF484 family)
MRIDAQALQDHAADVCSERMLRTRHRLGRLSAAQLSVVEETAEAVGQAVACCLLESAAADASLEAVLAGLYPSVGDAAAPG